MGHKHAGFNEMDSVTQTHTTAYFNRVCVLFLPCSMSGRLGQRPQQLRQKKNSFYFAILCPLEAVSSSIFHRRRQRRSSRFAEKIIFWRKLQEQLLKAAQLSTAESIYSSGELNKTLAPPLCSGHFEKTPPRRCSHAEDFNLRLAKWLNGYSMRVQLLNIVKMKKIHFYCLFLIIIIVNGFVKYCI